MRNRLAQVKRSRRLITEKERIISLFIADLEKLVTQIDPSHWRCRKGPIAADANRRCRLRLRLHRHLAPHGTARQGTAIP